MDPEVFLGTLLQEAPRATFRYVADGAKPSDVLKRADPTPGVPGLNSYAVLPNFPHANYFTTTGLIVSTEGEAVGRSIGAMSPFQNSLRPPPAAAKSTAGNGRAVFERAGCASCHSGPGLTNHRVVPADEIGTEPTRARAFQKTEQHAAAPKMFAPETPMPPPASAKLIDLPMTEGTTPDQVKLAWAHGGTAGGYKVPGLMGLAWSAPYLHDGGVAAGPNIATDLGVGGLYERRYPADPANSLRALLDRGLRSKVKAANAASEAASGSHVTGAGHAYWVDAEAGFSADEQQALIDYLLTFPGP